MAIQVINLGTVRGIVVGVNPPTNKKILWYDDAPLAKTIKFYDTQSLTWKPIVQDLGDLIDDTLTVTDKTWSSQKISDTIDNALTNGTSKTIINTTGDFSINWQTDIAPGGSQTYAQKHGNDIGSIEGVYEDGSSFIGYKPGYNYTMSGGLIQILNLTEVFEGKITIV